MKLKIDVNNLCGTSKIIKGSRRASVLLCGGILLHIKNALCFSNFHRKLLNFKDINLKGYHIEIKDDGYIRYLSITQHNLDKIMCNGNAIDFFLKFVLNLY